jgi:hypothetical protein
MPIVKGYILKNVGNDYMIIPTNSNNVSFDKIFNINETASVIYNKLKEDKDIDTIAFEMSQIYNAKEDVLKKDIIEFIEELKKRGIYKD